MSASPVDLLIESARGNRLHHALILHGPSPSTLRAAALRLARTLNCPDKDGEDNCATCARVDRGIHPDVQMIALEKERKRISIEQIRAVIGDAGLRPYEGGVKVFVIDPADSISDAGANSLLKTLEEPASDTAFILLTSSADLLLPTIRSRCQIIFLRPEEAVEEADHSDVVEDVLDRLARFAAAHDYGALLGIAPVLLSIEDFKQGLTILATILRDIAAETRETGASAQILETIGPRPLLDAAQAAVSGIDKLKVNADVRLLIEDALLIIAEGRRVG